MRSIYPLIGACLLWAGAGNLHAQTGCDPSLAPRNLQSTYTPGAGALLSWDAVPGSVGVRLKAVVPGGATVQRNILGIEPDQFLVPDAVLDPGTYTWWVQATCNLVPPFAVTPISVSDTFTVGGGSGCPATVTDVDGNVYPVVAVGTACWMGANLDVDHYRDGSPIPGGLSDASWNASSFNGVRATYDGDPALAAIYGQLYSHWVVSDPRGVCPTGWHVPDDTEWTDLAGAIGGGFAAGGALKTVGDLGAGTGLWASPNIGATDLVDFHGLPGGYRDLYGAYGGLSTSGSYWSATAFNALLGWSWVTFNNTAMLSHYHSDKRTGFSVRCVQD